MNIYEQITYTTMIDTNTNDNNIMGRRIKIPKAILHKMLSIIHNFGYWQRYENFGFDLTVINYNTIKPISTKIIIETMNTGFKWARESKVAFKNILIFHIWSKLFLKNK